MYSNNLILPAKSPENAPSTIASPVLPLTVAVVGVSVLSIPSAIAPNLPYEQLPLVALIIPPFSARYPTWL